MSEYGIKKAITECLDELMNVCDMMGVNYNHKELKPTEIHLRLENNELIRLYSSKKGVTIDDSQAGSKELSNKIIERWKDLYGGEIITNKSYTYFNVLNQDIIKDDLLSMESENNKITFKEYEQPNIEKYYIKITNDITTEKVTIKFYSNHSIQVQGLSGEMWEEVCQLVEIKANILVKDILDRISAGSNNIDTDKTANNFKDYENSLKNILTEEVFNFLSTEDRVYLTTAQSMIEQEAKFPEYKPIICPAVIAFEGYVKLLLVKLDLVKCNEISKSNWNFYGVFDKFHKLIPEMVNKIKPQDVIDIKQTKQTLEHLYNIVRTYRHTTCHSGAGLNPQSLRITNFEKCKDLYMDKILKNITESYYKIFKTGHNS